MSHIVEMSRALTAAPSCASNDAVDIVRIFLVFM